MTAHEYTRDELNEMGAAYYGGLHAHDYSGSWETLHDFERYPHRQGVKALIEAKERIDRRKHAVDVPTHSRSVSLDRAG